MIRILSLFWLVILFGLVGVLGIMHTDIGQTSQTDHVVSMSAFVAAGMGVLFIGALAGIPKKNAVTAVLLLLPIIWLVLFILEIFFPAVFPYTIRF